MEAQTPQILYRSAGRASGQKRPDCSEEIGTKYAHNLLTLMRPLTVTHPVKPAEICAVFSCARSVQEHILFQQLTTRWSFAQKSVFVFT